MSVATEVQPSEAGTRRAWACVPGRTPAPPDHPCAPQCALVRRRCGVRRRVHGPARRQHRDPRLPLARHGFHAGLAAVSWVGLIYLLVLVAAGRAPWDGWPTWWGASSSTSTASRSSPSVRGSARLAPSLGALDAFRALQALGRRHAPGQQPGHHHLGAAPPLAGQGTRHPGRRTGARPRARPHPRRGARGGRRVAVGLPRLGARGGHRRGDGWIFLPRSHRARATPTLRLAGSRAVLPRGGRRLVGAVSFGDALGWASAPVIALGWLPSHFGVGLRRPGAPRATPDDRSRPVPAAPGVARHRVRASCAFLVLFGVLCVAPLYLERGLGLDPATAGFELMAMPAVLVVVALFAGRLGRRLRVRHPDRARDALRRIRASAPSRSAGSGLVARLVGLACIGAGLGAFTPANNSAIMSGSPGATPRSAPGC